MDPTTDHTATPAEVREQISFALWRLSGRNGHHAFEDLCRDFARERLGLEVRPATGPVSAGGDGGRDFETFSTFKTSDGQRAGAAACTLQKQDLQAKIREDIGEIVSKGDPVEVVYMFCTADLPEGRQRKLRQETREKYHVRLDIWDGNRLSDALAAPDHAASFWIAERYLDLPPFDRLETSRFLLHRYLSATQAEAAEHPYVFRSGDGLSRAQTPSLPSVYIPPKLLDRTARDTDTDTSTASANGPRSDLDLSVTWEELLERHRHLLVRGGPGLGKSSLLKHIADATAAAWLEDRPVDYLPVRLHARHLATDKPMAEAVRDGAVAELSPNLMRRLPVAMFERAPQPEASWLVLVDGIDELPDAASRERALRAVIAGIQHEPAWRFVVATRPLPPRDLTDIRKRFGECELRPFDRNSLSRFATSWFQQQPASDPDILAGRLLGHVRQMHAPGLGNTPLVATMLCVMLAEDPGQQLPVTVLSVYERFVDVLQRPPADQSPQVVRDLQAKSLDMLEHLAYERQTGVDYPLLDLAVAWAAECRLYPTPDLRGQWSRVVHDVLCGTGAVVSASDGRLTFWHHTIEEYLAARHLFERLVKPGERDLSGLIREFLADPMGEPSELLLVFLGHLWAEHGRSLDWLATQALDASRDVGLGLAEALIAKGLPLTAATAIALKTIAADEDEFRDDRVRATAVLEELDPDAGAALLLGMAVDVDFDDDDRIWAMRRLCQLSPAMTAALVRLMWMTDLGGLDFPYRAEANDLVTGNELDERAYEAGLNIILANEYLDDRYRAEAGAMLIDRNGRQGYEALKAEMGNHLVADLAEALPAGSSAVRSALSWIVRNTDLPSRDRLGAAEAFAFEDPRDGAQEFRVLADDHTLDAQARAEAAKRAAELAGE